MSKLTLMMPVAIVYLALALISVTVISAPSSNIAKAVTPQSQDGLATSKASVIPKGTQFFGSSLASNRKLTQAVIPAAVLNLPANGTSSGSGLSAGAWTGVILGCLAAVFILVVAFFFYMRWRDAVWAAAHPPPPQAIPPAHIHVHAAHFTQNAEEHWAYLQTLPNPPAAQPSYVTTPAAGHITQVSAAPGMLVIERQPLASFGTGDGQTEQLVAASSVRVLSVSVGAGAQVTAGCWLVAIAVI